MDVTTPDGKLHQFSGRKPSTHATLKLHDWRAIPVFATKGDTGFAEAYRDGWWDSDDLTNLFLIGLQNESALDKYIYGSVIGRIAARFSYLFTRNTLGGSKRNIHAHYDLGNEFYKLWLDESMTYSSALFTSATEDLLQAQYNKYDRIIGRLGDSGRLLEIGCGWGGFAERAVSKKDYEIKGLTISNAQHEYAKNRLGNNAQIALEDYRLQQGKYNNIVSIEMFEAVGERFWPVYFCKLKSLLEQKGKAVVQTITIGNEYFERYRTGGDMIRTYIFPGGMLPSSQRFAEESKKAGLQITDTHMFGQDYALTAQHWLKRFEAKLGDIKTLGFDEPFIRLWRFYLTCCIASFKVGRTDVMQVELVHA
ncbi:MAG: cyclopropane-fatty-acyl-phospholipid synthase family protein [Rickettsiales bacterium]|nr:cyclopropane-fatty-acyl-phospholipid synthase family protein [Rickettsiales bacterium]